MQLSHHSLPSSGENLELALFPPTAAPLRRSLSQELADFREFGTATRILNSSSTDPNGGSRQIPMYVNEFWTARQRQAHSLHEISYRACFKPQLPRFFIERLTEPGDTVYDPFMGRGTTLLEAALLNRIPYGCDVNPLSTLLTRPRFSPPSLPELARRLSRIDFNTGDSPKADDLLVFYHSDTLRQINALRDYLLQRRTTYTADSMDEWILLLALNRLTGHSPGFFSVYTLPPNQAVSVKSQKKINADRNQAPPFRSVPELILKKTRQLLRDCDLLTLQKLHHAAVRSLLVTGPSHSTPEIRNASVTLVITSPPFLNVVDYATDNWLRCWFAGIDPSKVKLTVPKKLDVWQTAMTEVFRELHRVLKPGGHVAFEVGEVHGGKTKLEEAVVPCGIAAGLDPLLVLVNDQKFTKTANCWGVDNRVKGTNTNRIVLFRKPGR